MKDKPGVGYIAGTAGVCVCVLEGERELELLKGKFLTLMIPINQFTIITLGNRTRVAFYEVGLWDENINSNLSSNVAHILLAETLETVISWKNF